MSEFPDITPEGMRRCDWCGGDFLPEDMDGDHCNECSEQLFSEFRQ